MKKTLLYALGIMLLAACSDNDDSITDVPPTDNNKPEWYYAGGELGTAYLTTANAFEQPAPAVEDAGMMQSFLNGEALFEKQFMSNNSGTRHGLGPVYIRTSCMHCHPGYGHGQRIPEGSFSTKDPGNGCLLVVYNPETNAYVNWLAGMPQSHAVAPFKAPVDESKIQVKWLNAKDGWDNTFPDGETYELQYPEVTMPKEAIYVYNQGFDGLGDYEVRLESTIGIYGTGLLDAIDEKDIVAEWAKQEKDGYMRNGLNTAFFENGQWKSFYKNTAQGNGKEYVRRFTYAMSRGPLLDGAGANAIWNITNVTRSDRRYHYLDAAGTYAEYSAKDKEVQEGFEEYIAKVDPNKEHPSWWDGDMESRIKNYLTAKDLKVEMSDQEYIDLLIWHRGLAVPAVRDINNPAVQRGKEVFAQIGCDYCHRPSWTTGDDMVEDPALFKSGMAALEMPRYPQQKIWPYTDMVQHKLHMANDIRTGWCRTTPLWGRGLHQKCTGSATADRLHDCRARTALEAIMWHGYSEQSDAYECIKKFRELPKDDRDAVCAFVDAI
ncbi:MAG: di-heme oxidoredictase family protein [Bacteroidales bacterium]|nr:di-heme oxidoredictase family protein [Bacteroidales bacterium]